MKDVHQEWLDGLECISRNLNSINVIEAVRSAPSTCYIYKYFDITAPINLDITDCFEESTKEESTKEETTKEESTKEESTKEESTK